MALIYRFRQESDLPKLDKLWQNSTDWGGLTPIVLSKHFDDTPFGQSIVVVAENPEDQEIVGQAVFMPSRVSVRGKQVKAFRPFAPILARSFRASSLKSVQHPILQLHNYALEQLRGRGEQLLFALPNPRWMPLFRGLPGFLHSSFPLWSLPVPLVAQFQPEAEYSCGPLTHWDQRVDRLFEVAAQQFACMIVRDAAVLYKKVGTPDYEVLGIERSGELVGIVASKPKGDRQWLVCDLMAIDSEAEIATLQAVCNLAHRRAVEASSSQPIHKVAILAASRLQPSLKQLGFKRDNYDFYLVLKILDSSISSRDVNPSSWYLSAND